ncbi:MAG TPA: hypothetical protein PK655_02020 [archaeon]|jgi:hypothetical protein|nr:hypothetical protein [archaeon]HPV66212.1 hypothetical protein [archaeon]
MNKMKSIMLISCFILFIIAPVYASAMRGEAINNQTKECATYFQGDECMDCALSDPWIERKHGEPCPEGYREIKDMQAPSICTPIQNQFCCEEYHSGASGNCTNLVINNITKECAFVLDINSCEKLPKNWLPVASTEYKNCPISLEYKWLDDVLVCDTKSTNYNKFYMFVVIAIIIILIMGVCLKKYKKVLCRQ